MMWIPSSHTVLLQHCPDAKEIFIHLGKMRLELVLPLGPPRPLGWIGCPQADDQIVEELLNVPEGHHVLEGLDELGIVHVPEHEGLWLFSGSREPKKLSHHGKGIDGLGRQLRQKRTENIVVRRVAEGGDKSPFSRFLAITAAIHEIVHGCKKAIEQSTAPRFVCSCYCVDSQTRCKLAVGNTARFTEQPDQGLFENKRVDGLVP